MVKLNIMNKILLGLSLICSGLTAQETLLEFTDGYEIEITEPIPGDTIVYMFDSEAHRFLNEKDYELVFYETRYTNWAELTIYRKEFMQVMFVDPLYKPIDFVSIIKL